MSLGAVLLIVLIGCVLVPGLQQRITDAVENLSKASVQGPASVAFNYYILATVLALGASAVYIVIQAKAAKSVGIEPKGLEIQAPALPAAPQFGVESGISTPIFTSKINSR